MYLVVHFHLVVTQNGSVRVVKNKPNLGWDEVAIQATLSIPKKVFERPQFTAELSVPETALASTEIPVEVLDNLQNVLQQQTGYEVKLSFVPTDQQEDPS